MHTGTEIAPNQEAAATLLIVDDEESSRVALRTLLRNDGYRIEFAATGAEALHTLETMTVDLVLCDVLMPGLDGFGLCQMMKSHPEWRFVPTILVTALDGEDDLVRGLAAGADDFLIKPVQRALLRARVRALLRIRTQYREARAAQDIEAVLRARRERAANEARLSPRERDVLELLLLGRSHKDIGLVLDITSRTVMYHQANILEKLGADSRMDLLRLVLG